MAWRAVEVQEQGVRFVLAASRREEPLGVLCTEFGISPPTGRLWIKRFREAGLAGIREQSRRPRSSPARRRGSRKRRSSSYAYAIRIGVRASWPWCWSETG